MVIVITGPTATGKTDLGIYLAHKLNGEIINADSTQIYKGLDIATNKVQDTEGVVHHLFNEKDLREDYTVFDYQKDARKAIDDILSRGKVPILVGGTGLYINAALYDYKFEDKANDEYDGISNDELYKKLLEVDPNTTIHLNNRVRVISALNYYKLLVHLIIIRLMVNLIVKKKKILNFYMILYLLALKLIEKFYIIRLIKE